MPADPTDIAAGMRENAVASWTSASIAARYPSQAREGSVNPSTGFFDSVADAQSVVNARGAIIGTEARRFGAKVNDILWPAIATAVPTFTLVDAEQAANGTFIASRIEVDLDAEVTAIELFGAG